VEDSFFLHNSAFGYRSQRPEEARAGCVWAIGWSVLFAWVWDGTVNPYRSCSIRQTTRKRTPPVSTGLQAIDSEDTDEEDLARHGGGWLTQLS